MLPFVLIVVAVVQNVICYTPIPTPYIYQTEWYHGMPIDHFAFTDNRTFSMRYLINDSFYKPGGPIFFYCGNEGGIEGFANNSGFMWDIAPNFNALLLFAEHRFYGETQPFGFKEYCDLKNLGYLTTEQVLADYAVFLRWFKQINNTSTKDSPVIAFGGSYGGMLAAWMRMKYPHIITGSLAASAPILQFEGVTDCGVFSSIVTRTFKNAGPHCDECIKNSWPAIRRMAATAPSKLSEIFHLCNNSLITNQDNATTLINWLGNIYGSLAMVDYPYPADFLAPLPGWPVTVACGFLTNPNDTDERLLAQIYEAVSVYNGNTSCTDLVGGPAQVKCAVGWGFQSCTEMVMPMCNNGSDMFEKLDWNLTSYSEQCFQQTGVMPKPFWATTEYGADKIQAASNIIFSNGNLDPWSGGGVLSPVTGADTLYPIYINNAAHHYDLRGGNPKDTPEVLQARSREVDIIRGWLENTATTTTTSTTTTSASISLRCSLSLIAIVLIVRFL